MSTHQERLRGVFSLQETRKVGTGTTTRKTVTKTFWYVDQDDATGELLIQPLNSNFIPTGSNKPIERDELLAKYTPELEFYTSTVYPKIREVNQSIEDGDNHREKGELFSAEFEYDTALAVDEENVRANFGIGITYLEQGEQAKAENILDRLVTLDAPFAVEHKHLFNEFGISLRKNKMLDKALEYYAKAIELGQQDENLFLNVARVHLEKEDFTNCVANVKSALLIDPENIVAGKMLSWLVKNDKIQKSVVDAMHEEVVAATAKAAAKEAPDAE